MRRLVAGSSPYEAPIGFSRAVRVDDVVEVAGTAPVWPDGSCPEDAEVQADRAFELALDALRRAGGTPVDVVRTRMYLTDAAEWEAVGRAHGRRFASIKPAATMVVVAALLDPRWKVEVEVQAILRR
ncbi:RidA family protein [Euzebya pacifica]|uniref:RidA family protein n=1 Tax=Euzebya pacifica TaxID=1608957 RepID=UPI0030F4F9EB